MNIVQNYKRIAVLTTITFLLLTAIYILLPKTPLIITGYCWTLFGIVSTVIGLLMLTNASSRNYITRTTFPLEAMKYARTQILLSTVVILLDLSSIWNMSVALFCLLHIILLAFFTGKMVFIDMGEKAIEQTDRKVQEQTHNWRSLQALAESILATAPIELKKSAESVYEAIRYSDPVSAPDTQSLESSIETELYTFRAMIAQRDLNAANTQQQILQCKIEERNILCKKLKQSAN